MIKTAEVMGYVVCAGHARGEHFAVVPSVAWFPLGAGSLDWAIKSRTPRVGSALFLLRIDAADIRGAEERCWLADKDGRLSLHDCLNLSHIGLLMPHREGHPNTVQLVAQEDFARVCLDARFGGIA